VKKILFLTRHFPPLVSAGSLRAWKLARHLPEFGWEPLVVAPPDICGFEEGVPAPLSADFSGMEIHRTGKEIDAGSLDAAGKAQLARGKPVDALRSVKNRVSGMFSGDPEGAEWEKNAARLVERLLKEHPEVEMLYAQGPPVNPLLLALDTARQHHLTLILDVIDPVDPSLPEPGMGSQATIARIEERILMSGVTVLTPTRALKEYFLKKYPGRLAHDDITIVHNGYDGELSGRPLPPVRPRSPLMRWALLVERVNKADLHTLVRGIELFAAAEGCVQGSAEFVFFGEAAGAVARHVKKSPLLPMIAIRDCCTLAQELELCRNADVICTVLGRNGVNAAYIPERVVDALGMNKPLLAAVPDGATRQLVQEAGGITASITQAEEIAGQCGIMAGLWKTDRLPEVPQPVLKRYEIRQSLHELTREIARLLPL
jgi:hypothetical protein